MLHKLQQNTTNNVNIFLPLSWSQKQIRADSYLSGVQDNYTNSATVAYVCNIYAFINRL